MWHGAACNNTQQRHSPTHPHRRLLQEYACSTRVKHNKIVVSNNAATSVVYCSTGCCKMFNNEVGMLMIELDLNCFWVVGEVVVLIDGTAD